MQSTYIVNTANVKQSLASNSSYGSIPLVHSPILNSSETFSTNSSSNLLESSSLCLHHSVNSEEIRATNRKLCDTLHLQCATQVGDFIEIAQVDDVEHFDDPAGPVQVSGKNNHQQQLRKSPILHVNTEDSLDVNTGDPFDVNIENSLNVNSEDLFDVNTEDLLDITDNTEEVKNPLFTLLHNNGSRLRELIHDVHRNNLVPVGPDINLIGKITAKHLLKLATPPQRRISTSTLITWAKYFKCLFPKTPTSAFYAFKYEPYRRRDGTILQKKRAEGVLQVQLFQERRKLIKENRDALLRKPSTVSTDRNPCSADDAFNNKNLEICQSIGRRNPV